MFLKINAHKIARFASRYHKKGTDSHKSLTLKPIDSDQWHWTHSKHKPRVVVVVVILILQHSRTVSAEQVMKCAAAHRVSPENRPVLRRYRLDEHLSPFLSWRIQPLRSWSPRSIRAVAVTFGHNNPGRHRQECRQSHGATGTGIKPGGSGWAQETDLCSTLASFLS